MKPKILLVDDQKEIRETLIEQLKERIDFYVVEASCGKEAVDILCSNESFDVIVSDFCMSPIDGLSFFSYLKSQDINIPFILFSGSEITLPSLAPPFVGFVMKPNFSKVIQLIVNQVDL